MEMTMTDWAEREIAIAKKRERGDKPEDEWDYDCACYDSALKAYKALLEDGHSGYSWSITTNILQRLMREEPLTPIQDDDELWKKVGSVGEDCEEYQNIRRFSLFKSVHKDGTVIYIDSKRFICEDVNGSMFHNGFVSKIALEYAPITFPYTPKQYKVYVEEFLVDPRNGDYDTMAISYILNVKTGKVINVDRYFKEKDQSFVEIDVNEYLKRKACRIIKEEPNHGQEV